MEIGAEMIKRSSIFWGSVLILFGGIFLIDALGIIEINLWGIIGPILLILFGAWVLIGYFMKEEPGESETVSIPIKNARRAIINLSHGIGKLVMEPGTDRDVLMHGTFKRGVVHSTDEQGDTVKVDLRLTKAGFPVIAFPSFFGPNQQFKWNIQLTKEVPLELVMKIGVNEAYLDFTELNIEKLRLETGVSSTTLKLPSSVSYTNAVVSSGVASLTIHVPEQVAAKIRFSGGLMDFKIDKSRFPKTAGYYQSPDYETASQKVDLKIDGGIGSVHIQ